MQTFELQDAWQRTISDHDKNELTTLFKKTQPREKESITCIPYRLAYNHRQELLCTVLIHNTKDSSVDIGRATVQLLHQNSIVANHDFHFSLQLDKKTSMPWTYIFPKKSYESSLSVELVRNIEVILLAHTINN